MSDHPGRSDRTVFGENHSDSVTGNQAAGQTTRFEDEEFGEISPNAFLISTFQKWQKLKQFPTRSGEAEIFLVEHQGVKRILKLYFCGILPKREILDRIQGISRKHPDYFPRLFEVGFDEPLRRFFEIQEFFPLGSLRDWLDQRSLSRQETGTFLGHMAAALDLLHSHQILHLDLKPANILVASQEPPSFRLTDFGISSILEEEFSKKVTQVKGTSMYQSPESLSGIFHARSDWWSLGVILVELLAGKHPFAGMPQTAIFFHLAGKGFPLPETIEEPWRSLLKGLLARDPERRWGKSQVDRWLSGEPVAVEREFPAKARETKQTMLPLSIEEDRFTALEDLMARVAGSPRHWLAAEKIMASGALGQWLEQNQEPAKAAKMSAFLRSGRHPSFGLFRALVYFRPDLPPAWGGVPFNREFWSALLERALHAPLDGREIELLRVLLSGELEQNIRETVGMVPVEIDELFTMVQPFRDCPLGKDDPVGMWCFLAWHRSALFSRSVVSLMVEFVRPGRGFERVFRLIEDPEFMDWAIPRGFGSPLAWELIRCWRTVYPHFHPQAQEMVQELVSQETLLLLHLNQNPETLAKIAGLFVRGLPSVDVREWVLRNHEAQGWLSRLIRVRMLAADEEEGRVLFEKLHVLELMREKANGWEEVMLPTFLGRPLQLGSKGIISDELRQCLARVSLGIIRGVYLNPHFLPRVKDAEFQGVRDFERVLEKFGKIDFGSVPHERFETLVEFAKKYKSLENAWKDRGSLWGMLFQIPGGPRLSPDEIRDVGVGFIALLILPFGLAALPALLFCVKGLLASSRLRSRESRDLEEKMERLLERYHQELQGLSTGGVRAAGERS